MACRAGNGGPVSASDCPQALSVGVALAVDELLEEVVVGGGVLAEELEDEDESSGAGSRDPGGAVSSECWLLLEDDDVESSPLDDAVVWPVVDELPLLQPLTPAPASAATAEIQITVRRRLPIVSIMDRLHSRPPVAERRDRPAWKPSDPRGRA